MPKVLIADKLSPAAVAIFRERGVDADVKTGLATEELIKIVDHYDGIAIPSATKLTADVLKAAKNLKLSDAPASAWTMWTSPPPPPPA
jgi:D-3-phosphoglycerate dehydrogenase